MKLPKTLIGRCFYNVEWMICHNLKLFIKRHDNSIELSFIFLYLLLQLFLVYIVRDIAIALFILLFIFIMSIERIILKIKSKGAGEETLKLQKNYSELRRITHILRRLQVKKLKKKT